MGERVAQFSEEYIVQTKGRWAGRPLALERWQREFLDELYLVDEEGNNVYRGGSPRCGAPGLVATALTEKG